MKKVLLIEDNKSINDANKSALELEGYEVYSARTKRAGKRLFEKIHPDLLILDILLPDGNSLSLGKELKEKHNISILYLSALNTKEDVLRGLRAGGDDYMEKPYLMEELLLRVASLFRRYDIKPLRDNNITGDLEWHVAAKKIWRDGEDLLLQPKEYAVLEYLYRCSKRSISMQELAEKIWLKEDVESVKPSIYNCISILRKKITGSGCDIVFQYGAGYRFVEEKNKDN